MATRSEWTSCEKRRGSQPCRNYMRRKQLETTGQRDADGEFAALALRRPSQVKLPQSPVPQSLHYRHNASRRSVPIA